MQRYKHSELSTTTVNGLFETSNQVTIKIYDTSTGQEETLSSNVCTEIANTGIFNWSFSNLSNPPSSNGSKKYLFIMTNGTEAYNQIGEIVFGNWNDVSLAEISNQITTDHGSGSYTMGDLTSFVDPIVTGVTSSIIPPPPENNCRIKFDLVSLNGERVSKERIDVTAKANTPTIINGKVFDKVRTEGIYNEVTQYLYFDIAQGAEIEFSSKNFDIYGLYYIPAESEKKFEDLTEITN